MNSGARRSSSATKPLSSRFDPASMVTVGDATGAADADAAAALHTSLVEDDETIILILRPSALYIVLSAAGGLMFIVIVTLGLMWLARFPAVRWTDHQAVALGVALAGVRLGWQTLEWWTRLYILTDRRILRRSGVLRMRVEETPLRSIRHASVLARRRERLFGLGTIGFASGDSSSFQVFWVMISRPFEVHRIVVEAIQRYGRR